MSTEKELNPRRVAELLNRSAQQIDDTTLDALLQARRVALEKHKVKRAWLSLSTGQHIGLSWLTQAPVQLLVGIALTIALVFSLMQQMPSEDESDQSRIDIAILIDDMPLEAFVDKQQL